jgi:Family of unknown function (DUF6325)
VGPVDLLVLKFPEHQVSGGPARALQEMVDSGLIRVIDILFVHKLENGESRVFEIQELEDAYGSFDPVVAEITGLITADDVKQLTGGIEPGSSAAVMLFENAWAQRFADAVAVENGEVILNERIPRRVIDELLAAQAAEEPVAAG